MTNAKKPLALSVFLLLILTFAAITIAAQTTLSDEEKGFTETAHTPHLCSQQLHASRQQTYSKKHLIPKQLKLLSWNIYKAQNNGLYQDLAQLNQHADILLLQEAIEDHRLSILKPYWRFSPGYKSGDIQSGVMTLSR